MTNRIVIPHENAIFYPWIFQFPGPMIGDFTFEHQICFISFDFQVVCHDPLLIGFRVDHQSDLQIPVRENLNKIKPIIYIKLKVKNNRK
jgi:hypothetical protein